MNILKLSLKNYRNLWPSEIKPDQEINVIFGDNAQGKTNLLESIWLFTAGRSFRGSKDTDLIKFKEKKAQLEMNIFSQSREQKLKIELQDQKRKIEINDIPQARPSCMLGKLRAVVFSPEHLELIKEGPAGRRKFLDTTICQLKPAYAQILSNYKHILLQRNSILKNSKKNPKMLDTIDIWDEKLACFAAKIINQRVKHLELLKSFAAKEYKGMSGNKEELNVEYKSAAFKEFREDIDFLSSEIKKRLLQSRSLDMLSGITSVGAHRDDLEIKINQKSAKTFSSQGQQRSAVLALKLAETSVLEKTSGESPIVLLDDVMSELDHSRQDYILNSIKNRQVFITCCDPTTILKMKKGAHFEIKNGKIFS